ncbi:MAG: UbiA family prenyltransferase [Comamonadaceae bacterium]|nr:UbiA family prenyltransferase [Comamonadaceae bacterium]
MMVLHGAANVLSDVFDFRRGLDRDVTPVSGAIVRGWLTDAQALRGAAALFALGTAFGPPHRRRRPGRSLFVVGGIGVAVGAFYTLLKARALGDLAVFLNFGLLGGAGAWIVQTGRFSWLPVLWTAPMALLVIAILHANNWRDIGSDGERRVSDRRGLPGRPRLARLLRWPRLRPVRHRPRLHRRFPRLAGGPVRPMPLDVPRRSSWPCRAPSGSGAGPCGARRRVARWTSSSSTGRRPAHNLVFGLLSTAAVILEGILRVGMKAARPGRSPGSSAPWPAGSRPALFIALFRFRRLGPARFLGLAGPEHRSSLMALAFAVDRGYARRLGGRSPVGPRPTRSLSGIASAAAPLRASSPSAALAALRLFPFAAGGIGGIYALRSGVPLLRVVLLIGLVIGPGERALLAGLLPGSGSGPRRRPALGFVLTALLYTAVHLASGNIMLVLAAAVCGVFWGWLYLRFRSPLLNVVSHTLWDLLVFVLPF